ncbi:MAG: LuxR C-terminal-related transcriptional regulator [Kofleriaceae bacterium]
MHELFLTTNPGRRVELREPPPPPAPPPPAASTTLTPKELAVLELLAEGYSYLNTAGQLDITINTVRNHVRRIYEKLGVHTKSEAVLVAFQRGLLTT